MIDIIITPNNQNGKSKDETLKRIYSYLDSESEVSLSLPPRYIEQYGVEYMNYSNLAIGSISSFALETYPEVAALEVAMAIENGADFIEILLDYQTYIDERECSLSQIKLIAEEVADDAALWVALDSENFATFDIYAEAIGLLVECGVDGIVLNSSKKESSQIRYLHDCLDLTKSPYNELGIKIFTTENCSCFSDVDALTIRIEI